MVDENLKNLLKNMEIPPVSEEAKARALQAGLQAFEKNRQGKTVSARPMSSPTRWEFMKRSLTMRNAYIFAGSFATLAVVLALGSLHYSAIMPAPVAQAPQQAGQAEQKQALEAGPAAPQLPTAAASPELLAQPASPPPPPQPPQASTLAAPNPQAPGMAQSRDTAPVMAYSAPVQNAAPAIAARSAPGVAGTAGAGPVGPTVGMGPEMLSMMPAPGMPYPPSDIQPVPVSRDQFDAAPGNALKQVAQEPVSTFSIDVDTASYSFVRRMLQQRMLPQPAMVRVEEMINYFDYSYAGPESAGQPFKPSVTVLPSPWNPQARLVHIGIKGYTPTERPRANLVFLIDVSGSMNQPDKLPLVKSSLKMLLDQLRPEDTIGIVTYAGHAGVALPPTPVSQKQAIISVIDQLGAGGGTAGGEGIRSAYELARQNLKESGINRVILATDGDFNVGITDPAELTRYVTEQRAQGVALSVLGFGQGNYNDALMQKLAQNGNGNAAYIDSLNEARKVLVQQANATLSIIAKDVKIQMEWNPATVASYRLIGYESRMLAREDFNNDAVDAGEVGAGHSVTAIYEILPVGAPGAADPLRYAAEPAKPVAAPSQFAGEYGFLKLRYKRPGSEQSELLSTAIDKKLEQSSLSAVNDDVRFAVAVAAFGQRLKQQPELMGYSLSSIAGLAEGARASDPYGYRSEFVQLVRLAESLESRPATPAQPPVIYQIQ